jgi:hypothetical protein
MEFKRYKNQNDLLVTRACEVIENLNLQKLEISHDKPTRFPIGKRGVVHKDDVKSEIMRLGYGEADEISYTFVNKVFTQIIYLLKYNK